jgi:Zn-dependent protease
MIKPSIVSPEEEITTVGEVFGAPLVVKGRTWFPLTQLITWGFMTQWASNRNPERSWQGNLAAGAFSTIILLGSEWCHNLAHAAAAKLVSKPVDAIRITWGMPLLIYHDVNDPFVTPSQHIVRALGGPVLNILLLPFAWLGQRLTQTGSILRDVADTAVRMNAFLCTVSLLPIPGLDGGPLLKWSLVKNGWSVKDADETVRKVNWGVGGAAATASAAAFRRHRPMIGVLCAMIAGVALAIATKLLREQQ